MMPAWYQRMNARERVLAGLVAALVLVLLNLWILSSVFGAIGSTQRELAARRAKRDEWLRKHQPVLKNPAEASALLDQLKEVAGKYNVLIENPAIGSGETTP